MPRVSPYDCSICSRPVLSITGQDCYLPDYAARAATGGYTHSVCLTGSEEAEHWTELLVQNVKQVAKLLFRGDLLAVLWQENTEELIIVDAGAEYRLGRRRAASLRRLNDVLVCDVTYLYSLLLEDKTDLRDAIARDLNARGSFPLSRVVDAFGVRELLRDPSALEDGLLLPDAERPHVTFTALKRMAFDGMLRHQVMLPRAASTLVAEYLDRLRG